MISTAADSRSKRTIKIRRCSLFVAGLLLTGSLAWLRLGDAPEPPDVPVAALVETIEVVDLQPVTAPPPAVAELRVPAEIAYFEAVLLQGGFASKKTAIRELRHIGTEDATKALSLALGDGDSRIRRVALEALASIQGDAATAAIGSLYADRDPRVRADATLSLAMTGGASAVEYLRLAIHDPDPLVRRAAVNSLGDIGDDYSVTVIQEALEDPDEEVRQRAVEVIDEINDDAAFRALYPPMPD